jgi:hypothetical protein
MRAVVLAISAALVLPAPLSAAPMKPVFEAGSVVLVQDKKDDKAKKGKAKAKKGQDKKGKTKDKKGEPKSGGGEPKY